MDHLLPVGRCPACRGGMVDVGVTALNELRCASCQGAFLDGDATLSLGESMGQRAVSFRQRLASGRVPWWRPRACVRCRLPMRRLTLRTVVVDACPRCGGLWLGPGNLQRLSVGQLEDPEPGGVRRRVLTAVLEDDLTQVMAVAQSLEPPPRFGRVRAAAARMFGAARTWAARWMPGPPP
jgi:Zn-finger nucleic acid-binding protein